MPFQVNDSVVLISFSKYQGEKNEVTFQACLFSYFLVGKIIPKLLKIQISSESVKNFLFPIPFKQAPFAVSRMSVTMLSSAILSFKDMNHWQLLLFSLGDTATQHLRKLDLDSSQFNIREKCSQLALTVPNTYLSIAQVSYTEWQEQRMQMEFDMTYR